jgi:hypothetical protein
MSLSFRAKEVTDLIIVAFTLLIQVVQIYLTRLMYFLIEIILEESSITKRG